MRVGRRGRYPSLEYFSLRCPSFPMTVISRTAGAVLLLGGTMLPLTATAAVEPLFAEATPLVLKDGKIANVSVHRISFAVGAEALDEATASRLRALMEPFATDCFLTAQAIGHVAPGVTRDGDTLSAHRLARARADHIQAELAGLGMPQPAIASVWDWQFLVERSQVTLWIFSLNVGDDCEGAPLPSQPAASAEVPAGDTPPPPRELVVPDDAPEQADSTVADDETIVSELEPPEGASSETARPADLVAGAATGGVDEAPADRAAGRTAVAGELASGASAAAEAVIRDPLATAAVAPVRQAPLEPSPSAAVDEAEAAPPPTTVAAIDEATRTTGATTGGPADLAITFDVNSSFFPSGAVSELQRLLATLPADAPVEIELSGAVGTGDVRGASAEEAARYNAWMAERRVERVAEWLDGNAGGRRITVTERLIEGDPSRQVRLKVNVAQ